MKQALLYIAIILNTNLCASQNCQNVKQIQSAPDSMSKIGFFKGFNWGTFGQNGDYTGPAAENSMHLLSQTHADSVCIVFAVSMPTKNSVEILWDKTNPDMASDRDVRNAIRLAKEHHLKILLKPAVICNDGTWRGYVNFLTPDGKPDIERWQKWWQSYTAAMVHYAQLAQENNCRVFCIGCELTETEKFQDRWRSLIAQVRKHFKGFLVYNANHGREELIQWWDAVDMIGISAYYPVGTRTVDAALSENMTELDHSSDPNIMRENWLAVKERLKILSAKWNRPVLFAEVGVRSARGSSAIPWEFDNNWPYDGQEQADYYQTAMETFWNESWFAGFLWWAWDCPVHDKKNAEGNTGFCPYGKPAEVVVREWYAKTRE